jgi:hypothetical protein
MMLFSPFVRALPWCVRRSLNEAPLGARRTGEGREGEGGRGDDRREAHSTAGQHQRNEVNIAAQQERGEEGTCVEMRTTCPSRTTRDHHQSHSRLNAQETIDGRTRDCNTVEHDGSMSAPQPGTCTLDTRMHGQCEARTTRAPSRTSISKSEVRLSTLRHASLLARASCIRMYAYSPIRCKLKICVLMR